MQNIVSAPIRCILLMLLLSVPQAHAQPESDTGARAGRLQQFLQRRRQAGAGEDTGPGSISQLIPQEQQKLITWGTLTHDGLARSYAVFSPPQVQSSSTKVPLVINFHGGGGNAGYAMKSSQFNEKAMKEGFIVVYPEGTGPMKHLFLTWNARHCCASAMKNKIDDVGFTSDLIDKLVKQYPIDPKRVYATGLSNGGMMTNRVGEELSNKVAAIGPIVATLFGDEKLPVKPVAAIIFNGALDEHVKEEGGFGGARFGEAWDQTTTPLKVESQAVFWAKANGGSIKPTQVEDTATVKHLHYACPQNHNVDMYIVKDQGHAWPGGLQGSPKGDIPSKSIRATDLMWDFFKQQTR